MLSWFNFSPLVQICLASVSMITILKYMLSTTLTPLKAVPSAADLNQFEYRKLIVTNTIQSNQIYTIWGITLIPSLICPQLFLAPPLPTALHLAQLHKLHSSLTVVILWRSFPYFCCVRCSKAALKALSFCLQKILIVIILSNLHSWLASYLESKSQMYSVRSASKSLCCIA